MKSKISRIIARLRGASGSVRPGTVTCQVRGLAILLDVESEIEVFRAETYASKEPETLEWIERFFRSEDVIYDIGANVGLYSLFAAKHLNSRCKVYAFEPEALNYAKLNINIYLNGLSGTVVPCCLAVTDRLCFDIFNLHPNVVEPERLGEGLIAGSALHNFGEAEDHAGKVFKPVHVQGMLGVSLDDLWGSFNLDFPNHIKIDVDGLESRIIEGASKTLQDARLKSLMVEISAARARREELLRRFAQAGFVQLNDFENHSKFQLKGTAYEDSENTILVRPESGM